MVLADSKLAVLGAAFQQIEWAYPMMPLTLGLAFALGFSERLFDEIISLLETQVDSDRQAATKAQQPITETKGPPGGGPGGGEAQGGGVQQVAEKSKT